MNRITATFLCLMLCLAGTSLHATAFAAEQTSVSAPSAPSPATSAQVVALKTPVVPAPVVRPFPAPVTTHIVTVPASIDATGKTEVSAALNTFIGTVPDGSIIAFPTGATYLLDEGIQISKRHNLVFAGNSATLKISAAAEGDYALSSLFFVGYLYNHDMYGGCTDIVIHDFILVGNSPTPGIYIPYSEYEANLQIFDADRVEIYGITASAAYGDFFHGQDASDVWVHDCHAITVGRNGISVISGSGILVEDCAFDVSGYCTFDVEPNVIAQACSNVTLRNNTAGTWGVLFLGVEGAHTGAAIDRIIVDGNTVTGDSLRTNCDNGGTAGTRMTRITFTNNKGTTAAGPLLYFGHVDGLTVTGNIRPLSSGALTSIADCTGAR